MQLLELVETGGRTLVELGTRADHIEEAALARIERQWQAEVATARDVPVAHVAQPVVHPFLVLRRGPRNGVVRVEHRLSDLVARDEPIVDDAEDERRATPPADRVPVDDRRRIDKQIALAQRL